MERRPDIVLMVMDSARADRLSCYGYHRRTTPFLDELCSFAVVYDQAIAPAYWTLPSHSSLFTGLYPSEHGALRPGMALPGDIGPTMAEALSEAGYTTIALSNNPNVSHPTNLSRGFQVFDDAWRRKRRARIWKALASGHRLLGLGDDGAAATLRRAAELLRSGSQPLFLFLLFMDTHMPYFAHWRGPGGLSLPLRAWRMLPVYARFTAGGNWGALLRERPHLVHLLNDLYDGELSHFDRQLRRFFQDLAVCRGKRDIVSIITADHGEALGDHGKMSHGASVYDALGRVPLIIHAPGWVKAPARVKAQVQLTDIWPSLARRLGLPTAADHWAEKRPDLFDLDRLRDGDWPAFMETSPEDGLTAVRSNGYKYIVTLEGEELYDLRDDPAELKDLASQRPEILEKMRAELGAFRKHSKPYRGPTPTSEDREFVSQLRALGYL